MFTRQPRASEEQSTDRTGSEPLRESQTMSLDEFWDAMADEVEAMSHEDLRAELAPFKARLARQLH
jgi:hypothetical protein